MSTAFQGSYTSDLYNASKRYRLQFEKGVPLADSELREIQAVSDNFVRELVANNFPRGSSTNNGFKVIESASPANNFTIMGGDGTVNGAGVLFVDGYILFIKSATGIEYNQQDATGALTDDDYTKTTIPPLTTPGGARTDEVYVDFYFAEVSAVSGSEYTDASLIVSGIGSATANRIRQVQDIRVAEFPNITPADVTDGNGIAHKYVKIATLSRTATANITNAMITDNRILINSVNSLSQGTTITDVLTTNGQNIGNDTHRIGQIFMASTIDYKTNDLMFKNNGTELIRFTTAGNVGIGSTAPTKSLVISDGTVNIIVDHTATGAEIGTDSNHPVMIKANASEAIRILANGKVGIGTTNPTTQLQVQGDCLITNNLTVNGTTTTVNTETTATDMMVINQDDNQVAFGVNQTVAGNTAAVMQVTNAGTGAIATFVGIGTGTANVGIGTNNPTATLQVFSTVAGGATVNIDGRGAPSIKNATLQMYNDVSYGGIAMTRSDISSEKARNLVLWNNDTDATAGIKFVTGGVNNLPAKMTITSDGKVGIGTNNPQSSLHVQLDQNAETSLSVINANTGSTADAAILFGSALTGGNYGLLSHYSSGFTTIGPYEANSTVLVAGRVGDLNLATTAASKNIKFFTGATPSERMRITDTGVGIGTNNPTCVLDVWSSGGNIKIDPTGRSLYFTANNTNYIWVGGSGGSAKLVIENSAGNLDIATFTDSGKVGIGTTNPLAQLHIAAAGVNGIRLGNGSTLEWNDGTTLIYANTTGYLKFATGAVDRMTILNTGNVGIGTTSPAVELTVSGTVSFTTSTSGGAQYNPRVETWGLYMPRRASDGSSAPIEFLCSNSAAGYGFKIQGNDYGSEVELLNIYYRSNSATWVPHTAFKNNGNVGIGTTNPVRKLHIHDTTGASPQIKLTGITSGGLVSDGGEIGFAQPENELYLNNFENGSINFSTNGTEKMRITSSGFVGIGATNPATTLMVCKDSVYSDYAGQLNLAGKTNDNKRLAIGYDTTNNLAFIQAFINGSAPNSPLIINPYGGNVGIGTTNPTNSLTICNVAANDYTKGIDFVQNDGEYPFKILFSTPGSDWQMRFHVPTGATTTKPLLVLKGISDGTQYVGIGTTNPTCLLHLWGSDSSGADYLIIENDYGNSANKYAGILFRGNDDSGVHGGRQNGALRVHPDAASGTNCNMRFLTRTSDTLTEKMRITSGGFVGIGTAGVQAQLHVDQNATGANSIFAYNRSSSFASTIFITGTSTAAGTGFNHLECWSGGTSSVFKVRGDGQIYSDAGVTISSPADFAEWTKVKDSLDEYEVGDVVMQSDEEMTVCKAENTDTIYGIVTDRATFCGGLTEAFDDIEIKKDFMALQVEELEEKYNALRIAMTGHVPCKVKGTIKMGQRLTLSDEAGVAKAATTFEEKALCFAIARQDYDDEDVGLIEVRLL